MSQRRVGDESRGFDRRRARHADTNAKTDPKLARYLSLRGTTRKIFKLNRNSRSPWVLPITSFSEDLWLKELGPSEEEM